MFRLMYRQRRRLAFGAFLTVLAVFMLIMQAVADGQLGFDDQTPAWVMPTTVVLTLLVCTVIVLTLFCLWLVVFPNWRFMIEQFSLVFFIIQAFSALWPAHTTIPYIGPFLPFVVFFAILMNVYGTALDRFPVSLGTRSTRSFLSARSPEDLWRTLVPLPEHKAAHWDSLLTNIDVAQDATHQNVRYNHGASVFAVQRQSFTKLDAPHRATYRFDGNVTDANKPITAGTFDIRIDPINEHSSRVTLHERQDACLPRVALQAWFDDSLGDVTDSLRARERAKSDWSLTSRYRRKVESLS